MNRLSGLLSNVKPGLRFLISGAIAAVISTIIFTVIHDLFISDIWFSLVMMSIAAVACGVCLSWSYIFLFKLATVKTWIQYNLIYDLMLMLLGLVSVLVFEPITTVAAAIAANEPPTELILKALPMTALFTLLMAIVINQLYGRTWRLFGIILITCIILVSLLGLNVSAIGLVSFAGSSIFLIFKLFLLILVLNIVFVAVFILLERKTLLN